MSEIYVLSTSLKFDDQFCYLKKTQMEREVCPGDPSHAKRQRWGRPLQILGSIVPITDIECTVFNDLLVGPEIVSALKAAHFSGIDFTPVELFSTTEIPISREVYELKVTGWGGQAPPESGIKVKEECPYCGRQVFTGITNSRMLFDIDGWDGSDFFIIWPMPKYIIVTAKVRDFFLERAYSGVAFHTLDKLCSSRFHNLQTFSPGNLADWFDRNKLVELNFRARGN
jgi:hypothetical protein